MIGKFTPRPPQVNFGQPGFYRVCYAPKLLAALGPLVPSMPASDRAGLVGDAFALASAGYQPTVVALSLLANFKAERDYVVWANIASGLSVRGDTSGQSHSSLFLSLFHALDSKHFQTRAFERAPPPACIRAGLGPRRSCRRGSRRPPT